MDKTKEIKGPEKLKPVTKISGGVNAGVAFISDETQRGLVSVAQSIRKRIRGGGKSLTTPPNIR